MIAAATVPNFVVNSFADLIIAGEFLFTYIANGYAFTIITMISWKDFALPIPQILIREYHFRNLILQFMCNLLQHFGFFITTYRAGIYLAAFLGTGGIGYDRIAISMLPGGQDVFFFMIAAGGTGEKFFSFGSTGGLGYDLFLVGVARGRNYVHFFIAAYRTGGNFLSILCAGRCCDYRWEPALQSADRRIHCRL